MTDKTGGAAFPSSKKINRRNGEQWTDGSDCIEITSNGMDLRDYFAAKALQGMLSNEQCKPFGMSFSREYQADCAYRMADAMLKARG